jgi:Sigma-70 factor, region 1.1
LTSALLDLSDGAVKALIRGAKERGYVTHDQINALLSSFCRVTLISLTMNLHNRR